MKTFNYISIAFAGLAMFCACNKAELDGNAPVADGDKVELVAGDGQIVCLTPPMTKTAVGAKAEDGSFPVVWLDKDQVKVYGESVAEGAVYTATVDQSATSAVFTADQVAVNDDVRYAVYPAALAGAMTAEGITVDLTSLREQVYHSNIPNFGQFDKYIMPEDVTDMTQKEYYESATVFPHLPLWSKAENGSSEFTFQNLMGVVKLALNDYQGNDLRVKTLKMTAKTPISGTMTVAADGSVSVAGADDAAKTVTIFSEAGVEISDSTPGLGDAGVAFYFFVPVGTYEGFDFEITTTDGRIFRKSTQTVVEVKPGIVKKFHLLNITLFYGKTNCYQIANASSVDIDITPRYSFDMTFNGAEVEYVDEASKPTFTPEIVWNLTRNGQNLQGSALTGTPVVNGNILTVKSNAQGNGLVAIKDADGKIVWSYHIWVVKPDEQPVTDVKYVVGSDEFYMMSHTLGGIHATDGADGAYNTFGMFYQWGRKEPLPAYGIKEYSKGVTALFNSAVNQKNTIADAIANPLTMYINYNESLTDGRNMATTYEVSPANGVLWGATESLTVSGNPSVVSGYDVLGSGFVKTVYDPCPEGYMIPQLYHFNGLTVAKPKRDGYGAHLYYDIAKEKSAYYPLPGVFLATQDVISGTTNTTGNGTAVRFQTSNPAGTSGWAFGYFRVTGTNIAMDRHYGGQATACSVRCLKIK